MGLHSGTGSRSHRDRRGYARPAVVRKSQLSREILHSLTHRGDFARETMRLAPEGVEGALPCAFGSQRRKSSISSPRWRFVMPPTVFEARSGSG